MNYDLMLGNNLSQLGIDAGQLDNGLNNDVVFHTNFKINF